MTAASYLEIVFSLITTYTILVVLVLGVPQLISYAIFRFTKSLSIALVTSPVVLVVILGLMFDGGLYLGREPEIDGIRWTFAFSLCCLNLLAAGIILGPLRSMWRDHQLLPLLLRVHWLVPFSVGIIVLSARLFELPPGPLCDEGMVLFMEGGCDYGVSNIFFHSKLGLLVSLNIAFVVGWLEKSKTRLGGYLPHFVIAGCLALANWSGGYCDTYYDHPNGSIGQMVLEVTAFALLGVVLLQRWSGSKVRILLAAVLGWNLSHTGVFYLWLALFNHWTWAHTIAIMVTLTAVAFTLRAQSAHARLAG
jgi:hypothetical protein